ncbi:MAG: EamA family transporter [Raoultibacter sp.]
MSVENNVSTNTGQATSGEYTMNKRWGAIAMIISATGMGLVGFFSRFATAPISEILGAGSPVKAAIGSFLALGRMSVGLIGFIIILIVMKKVGLFKKTKLSPAIVFGGICIGLSLAFYVSSTLMTTIANAVFFIYTGPLYCTLLARIFRKEKIDKFQGVCLLIVFIGMLFTSGIVNLTGTIPTETGAMRYGAFGGVSFGLQLAADPVFPLKTVGDLFGILSGVFYGLSLFFNGYRKDVDSIVRGVWNFLFAACGAGFMCLMVCVGAFKMMGIDVDAASFGMGISLIDWPWAFGLFICSGLVALGFLVIAGRNLPAVEYSTISYWECVVAVFISFAVFGELAIMTAQGLDWTGVTSLLGGFLIVVAGFAPILAPMFKKKAPAALEGEASQSAE